MAGWIQVDFEWSSIDRNTELDSHTTPVSAVFSRASAKPIELISDLCALF